jgi:hypothetical protein
MACDSESTPELTRNKMTKVTKTMVGELLKEGSLDTVKQQITQVLWAREASVTFTKVDGTERVMRVTLDPRMMEPEPPKVVVESAPGTTITPKNQRPHNPDVRTVYDLDAKMWKSFRWDKLISISYEE